MISYEEAIAIIDAHATPMRAQTVDLSAACGRFAGADVFARYDSPPFDNSAVDGYGRRKEDLGKTVLEIVGDVPAGKNYEGEVLPGRCVRILTGAMIPRGVAAVSMQEDCEVKDGQVTFHQASKLGENIRLAGSDVRAGDRVVSAGDWLGPAATALAASVGIRELPIFGSPRIGMLTTGSELMDLSQELTPAKIYNSNFSGLAAAVDQLSDEWVMDWSSDEPDMMTKQVSSMMINDVVITIGGISVGDHDLVKGEFARLGIDEHFWGVAIKPGKPVYFGTLGEKLVFGLPGNPVSALITYLLFVRPAILKLMGDPDPWPKPVRAVFRGGAKKKAGRTEFLRGVVRDGEVRSLENQSSHQLGALAEANCLVQVPAEDTEISDGREVAVLPIRWGVW